ncbi:CRISPR-associated endonuclease Cas1 [Vibrio injensis]|uniref:CRISPR-associated endonuclease Cas1 n=1 Tax=Vibrio injensis TaxID=1307414 RepID=UPI000AAC507F|nr:CRISPR-associated endonuclease Cas1 [Vibrio injensis]
MTQPLLNSIEPIAQLLPLRAVVVTLRFTQSAALQFYHHVAVHTWVRYLCGSPANFSQQVTVQTLENGKTTYQPQEFYRFKLVFTPLGATLIQPLFDKLSGLPHSAHALPKTACLHANVELHSLYCGVSGEPVQHAVDLYPYGLDALAQDVHYWQQQDQVHLQSLTPTRFLLPKTPDTTEATKGERRYCRDKADFTSETLTKRLLDTLVGLLESHTGIRYQREVEQGFDLETHLSFWVEHRYGKGEPKQKKPLGGALFSASLNQLALLPRWQMAMLVLGQWLGVGQSRSMGLGVYCLTSIDHLLGEKNNRLLVQYFAESELNKVVSDSLDHPLSEQQQREVLQSVMADSESVIHQRYLVSPLQQMEIDREEGGTRTLSIPPLIDRILQQAIARPLAASLEGLWKSHSYGYRSGLSRHDAKLAINQAIQNGYEWLLESDVASFFDHVDWHNLETRLTLLLPNDALVDTIMAWVKAPIKTVTGEQQPRQQGLPQGSPLSPLLANLILDDFDADMLALDYQLVRYADDFVLLFKTEQQAQAALHQVIDSLNEHGLSIKAQQTITRHHTQRLQANTLEQETIGEREQLGTLLVVAGEVALLSSEEGRLKITQEEQTHFYSWEALEAIFILGPHNITTPCLRQAMLKQVPIHFASNYGQYQGVACANTPTQGHQNWQVQMAHMQQIEVALPWSIELVVAKIDGHIHLIRNRDPQSPLIEKLRHSKHKARRSRELSTLLGFEGEAAKLLWQFFAQQLEEQWQFTGRNRRPPRDPVNALLSLGYTYLYHLTDALIQANGLCPWVGFYHQPHGAHRTLASDLMEPFRVVVERTALTLINKRQLKPEDFVTQTNGCEISREARKRFLTQLLADLTGKRPKQDRIIDQFIAQIREVKIALKLGSTPKFWRP